MKIVFHAEAQLEFSAAAMYYKSEAGVAIARAFRSEVERVAERLREYPEFGTTLQDSPGSGCRRYPLRRFPYDLMYRVKGDAIRILAVAHQHRQPGYWQSRT